MNQLPESANNTLYYKLYLSKEPNRQLLDNYNEHLRKILGRHLEIKINTKHKYLCYGKLKFDLKAELEWLAIYGLFELSKFDQDLVIRAHDNDGDVILIEAAELLPAWLETSDSEGRVFIHKGKVHILPQCVHLRNLPNKFKTASEMIREQQVESLAKIEIQTVIEKQLSGLPDTEAWLSKKLKLLDEIISGDQPGDCEKIEQVESKPEKAKVRETLTLNSIRAMNEESLRTSPLSSSATSSLPDDGSSNDWSTEEDENI